MEDHAVSYIVILKDIRKEGLMKFIDEKFKDAKPEDTVERIKKILDTLGIQVHETWYESGLENCYSLSVFASRGLPSSNGKGVTKAFARASAYGEFIERLQGGLHMYKFQSLIRDPDMNLQAFAPDCKYMTVEELIENGEWMDSIISNYGNASLDRATIAQLCKVYACADDGKILTLPFYSLFENKYVYLPIDFVDQVYATNGCCAGNTREEAWVHALSEIMERHANIIVLTSGKTAPKFPDEVINKYPVVSGIIKQIKESGDYDVDILDYSLGSGFPVVATRIINKKTHSYRVKVAADPIFEIALQRNLTELFQGSNINNITSNQFGFILNQATDFPAYNNTVNQLETGSGVYTADYFADELISKTEPDDFIDNTSKNNRQLLDYILEIFRKANKQIYVRNFSYLGFPSYRFVVPGFSEAFILKLDQTIPEHAIADMTCKYFRNPIHSSNADLRWLLNYSNQIKLTRSRYENFGRIAGVPLAGRINGFLANITRSYACYRLQSYDNAIKYLNTAIKSCDEEDKDYLVCINKYIELKKAGIDEDKIKAIISKFFAKSVADEFFASLQNNCSPYDVFLLSCDFENCDTCRYRKYCCYQDAKQIFKTVRSKYRDYAHGQDESEFCLN